MIISQDFSPASACAGGALLGLAVSANLLLNGRVTGISGILNSVVTSNGIETAWKASFIGGMLLVAASLGFAAPGAFRSSASAASAGFVATVPAAAVAGLLVGFGTSMGSGCTSGHGLCGLPRRSGRSVAAVAAFFVTGMATASAVAASPGLDSVVRQADTPRAVESMPSVLVGAALLVLLEVLHRLWRDPHHKAVNHNPADAERSGLAPGDPCERRVGASGKSSESAGSDGAVAPCDGSSSPIELGLGEAPALPTPGDAAQVAPGSHTHEPGPSQGPSTPSRAASGSSIDPASSEAAFDRVALGGRYARLAGATATPGALLSALAIGALFAGGLALSGMTNPAKVVGFLAPNSPGGWDPSLLLVLASGLVVNGASFFLILRRPGPLLGVSWHLPTKRDLSAPLILGSALFGVGWGVAGLCPGPSVVWLGSGTEQAAVFFAAMLAGSHVHRVLRDTETLPGVLRA